MKVSIAKELATLRTAAEAVYKAGPSASPAVWGELRRALNIPDCVKPGGSDHASPGGSRTPREPTTSGR